MRSAKLRVPRGQTPPTHQGFVPTVRASTRFLKLGPNPRSQFNEEPCPGNFPSRFPSSLAPWRPWAVERMGPRRLEWLPIVAPDFLWGPDFEAKPQPPRTKLLPDSSLSLCLRARRKTTSNARSRAQIRPREKRTGTRAANSIGLLMRCR